MEKSGGGRQERLTEQYSSSPTRRVKKVMSKSSALSPREKLRVVSVENMRKRPELTADQRKQLEAIRNRPDSKIDFSDIPERTGARGPVYINLFPSLSAKKSITIRLDDDMVKWFKKQGKGWQTKMNWVLRLYFASHRKTGVKVGRP